MKLLLRKNQKSGLIEKVAFVLDVQAELSADERRNA